MKREEESYYDSSSINEYLKSRRKGSNKEDLEGIASELGQCNSWEPHEESLSEGRVLFRAEAATGR